jgi:hypothetical protein
MFRLIATVKQGVASDLEELGVDYGSIEDARAAAVLLGRHENVTKVMIARADVPPRFVEWAIY